MRAEVIEQRAGDGGFANASFVAPTIMTAGLAMRLLYKTNGDRLRRYAFGR